MIRLKEIETTRAQDMPRSGGALIVPPLVPASVLLWVVAWLFTIGYAHLVWWKATLAVAIWPYFLGAAMG